MPASGLPMTRLPPPLLRSAGALALLALSLGPAAADRIRNPTAVFSGLDKITGRIISFEVAIDETVQFGALQVTPRVCWSRPPTETPLTDAFVEVDEVTLTNEYRRIFTGWMFAASPGLHAVEHAVYDVWLTECKGGTEIVPEPREASASGDQFEPPAQRRPARVEDEAGGQPAVQPRAPSRQFFPTNRPAAPRDPAGGNSSR